MSIYVNGYVAGWKDVEREWFSKTAQQIAYFKLPWFGRDKHFSTHHFWYVVMSKGKIQLLRS